MTINPQGIKGNWSLILDEKFAGTTLNSKIWSTGYSGSGINLPMNPIIELQAYDPAQVAVNDGLTLTVINKPVNVHGTVYQYRSGMVTTANKFTFVPTATSPIAVEAKVLVGGEGSVIENWPAFFCGSSNWPDSGEIDVFEGMNGVAAWHFIWGDSGVKQSTGQNVTGDYVGWHTFGAYWDLGRVNYHYDGVIVGSVTANITNIPMYLTCDLAVSTVLGGPLTIPSSMQVAYVRVWIGS